MSFWQTTFNPDGWSTDNNQPLTSSFCVDIEILGGIYVLFQGQKIEISLDLLLINYGVQIVFKLWVIGDWNNELFTLFIEDLNASKFLIMTVGQLNFECGVYQQIKIINSIINASHSSAKIKLTMEAQQIIQKNAFWGLQSFHLFSSRCPKGCLECSGYQKSQCSKCIKKWVFLNDGCLPVPPIECTLVRNTQLNDFKVNLLIHLKSTLMNKRETIKKQDQQNQF